MAYHKHISTGMKKNEIRVEHHTRSYELGHGKVWVRMPDATSFNPHEISFERKGRRNIDSLRIEQGQVSTSSFRGTPDDTIAWAKAMLRAAKEAKRTITKAEVKRAQAEEKADLKASMERDRLKKEAKERRFMTWTKNSDGTYSELNGLFTIVPNNRPEWKENSKKWLVRGPQYGERESWFFDKAERHRDRKAGDHWDELKQEEAVSSVASAQKEARRMLENMLRNTEDHGEKKAPLLREKGKSGKVVLTELFLKRQKKTPLQYRDNTMKEEVKV